LENLYKLRNTLVKDGVIFSFSGTMSQSILIGIAETLENRMEMLDVKASTVQSIFSVFIEQMQNIIKYSADKYIENSDIFGSLGIVVVGFDKLKQKYYVSSGNLVENGNVDKITKKIEDLKNRDKKSLREYYKELRKSGINKHDKGAGLGFIEMAKKSSEPIDYVFQQIDDTHSFFTIRITI